MHGIQEKDTKPGWWVNVPARRPSVCYHVLDPLTAYLGFLVSWDSREVYSPGRNECSLTLPHGLVAQPFVLN